MTAALFPAALAAYVAGIVLASLVTIYRVEFVRAPASVAFGAGWVLHAAAVILRGVEVGRAPLESMGEFLVALGLVVMALHLWIWFRWRAAVVGLLLPSLATLFGVLSMFVTSQSTRDASVPRGLFFFHTGVSTLGMAALLVALAMSVLFVIQDRALKSHRTLRVLDRLPPLERCESIGFHALVSGFVLFSLGIATGAVVNALIHGHPWNGGAKQVFPTLAWVIFATVLAARTRWGFRGRLSAYWTIAGVAVGLLTIAGMSVS